MLINFYITGFHQKTDVHFFFAINVFCVLAILIYMCCYWIELLMRNNAKK